MEKTENNNALIVGIFALWVSGLIFTKFFADHSLITIGFFAFTAWFGLFEIYSWRKNLND